MRVLVLGVTGMIGHAIWSSLRQQKGLEVWGAFRSASKLSYFESEAQTQLITGVDVLDQDKLVSMLYQVKPDVVINCIGIVKQLSSAQDPLVIIPMNALFPHRLSNLCKLIGARLIHMSTDCVFSGKKGAYVETDPLDAEDLYGQSKFLGEITKASHALTIRTSVIGHELNSNYALIDWFLSQKDKTKGYVNAIFSGLPSVELARVIRDYILPNKQLHGLYHIAAEPINKYELLKIVAEQYGKKIMIEPDHEVFIDRSLCGKRFSDATGYHAADWPMLIEKMYQSNHKIGAV